MLLMYFDPEKETVIQVNASNRGIDAALLQERKPIVFVSKSLGETEQWYANIEQKLQAVAFVCECRKQSQASRNDQSEKPDCSPSVPPVNVIMPTWVWHDHFLSLKQKKMALADGFSRLPNKRVK